MVEKSEESLQYIHPLTRGFRLMYETGEDDIRTPNTLSLFRLDLSKKCIQKLHTIKNHEIDYEILVDGYNHTNFALLIQDVEGINICKIENNRIVVEEVVNFDDLYDFDFESYYNGCIYKFNFIMKHDVYPCVSQFSEFI
jgi:hypothetical protein